MPCYVHLLLALNTCTRTLALGAHTADPSRQLHGQWASKGTTVQHMAAEACMTLCTSDTCTEYVGCGGWTPLALEQEPR
jgi:hypothetical protein